MNPDTGRPVILGEDQLRRADFRKVKHSEAVLPDSLKSRKPFFSPLWQADREKVQRMAPMEFIGRYLGGFFDYAIADEVHELKGETAQGNALGTIAGACERTVILTGTLLGGYADELFHILYRLDARIMREDGFEYGEAGVRQFAEAYGVLEKITIIEPAQNACSDAKVSTTVKRRPGASPLLFGKYLMNMAAFVSLEDISDGLPPYNEEVVAVEMDPTLASAYSKLEEDITAALREHHGNSSVISTAMNALLLYPDHPYGLGTLHGYRTDQETGEREKFVISEPADLDENYVYAKERRLIEEIKSEAPSRAQRSGLCSLHEEAGRHSTPAGVAAEGRDSSGSTDGGDTAGATRSLVRTPVAERNAGLHLSPEAGSDRPRLARLPNHLLRTDGLFDLHLAPGKPAKLADRAEGTGARRFLHIFGYGTGELSSADGKKAAGLFGDGGEAPRRRFAGHG